MSMTLKSNVVASFTDAWIETIMLRYHLQLQWVASFTDAWIETTCEPPFRTASKSHLLQMRGLKLKLVL